MYYFPVNKLLRCGSPDYSLAWWQPGNNSRLHKKGFLLSRATQRARLDTDWSQESTTALLRKVHCFAFFLFLTCLSMNSGRAPKQWSLTKHETITSFESWRHNLQYCLSLDSNFAPFLASDFTWLKKSPTSPLRGLVDDDDDNENIPAARRRTAQQKLTHLELMLGQIANFCPIISRNTIIKSSTSIQSIWQSIRAHFGFQSTGAHFIDLCNIKLEADERPEDLFQKLMSFVEDNLVLANGPILHHGENLDTDEEMTPTLENMIVLTWLKLIHPELWY